MKNEKAYLVNRQTKKVNLAEIRKPEKKFLENNPKLNKRDKSGRLIGMDYPCSSTRGQLS